MLLAGDIGGTKTVLALYDDSGGLLKQEREASLPSQAHPTFDGILDAFYQGGPRPPLRAACFGVAGPVMNGQVRTTNLPWLLDETALATALGAGCVKLLNDLEAAAFGMLYLPDSEMVPINPKAQPRRKGNIAIVAAGTGLGEAILYWDNQRYHPIATEGGHTDFAPQNEQEIALLRFLQKKYNGHVSYERLLSGMGVTNLFEYLRQTGAHAETPELKKRLAQGGDPNPVIGELGFAGTDPLCVATLEMFAHLYGVECGNLALKCLATGGVFVGGGIAPRYLSLFLRGHFLSGFTDKGRFRPLMESLPVLVCTNPRAPLVGAAQYAARMN
jgi:glucokinase